jgi:hypothetical protein
MQPPSCSFFKIELSLKSYSWHTRRVEINLKLRGQNHIGRESYWPQDVRRGHMSDQYLRRSPF